MTIFVISDTHFHHKNILGYSTRPFKSVEEMDEILVENWNKVVKPTDKVYHLGDVYFQRATHSERPIVARLNGKKRLVLGNHDDPKDQVLQKHFQKIGIWRLFKDVGIILTHIPIVESSFRIGVLNVHGHTHEKGSPPGPYKSACVEIINYTPKAIEEFNTQG